jgi:hypothetical protein
LVGVIVEAVGALDIVGDEVITVRGIETEEEFTPINTAVALELIPRKRNCPLPDEAMLLKLVETELVD